WLSLTVTDAGKSRIYAAPFRTGSLAPEAEWVFIRSGDEQMQWSPDGDMLYFLSSMDGYPCLYAQRLDSRTKRPLGEPSAVYHLHDLERRLFASWTNPFNFAIAQNRVYLSIAREQSNIWMVD